MRIFLLSLLLLFVGLNQILARSLPWLGGNSQVDYWWNEYEHDLFRSPSNHYDDDLNKFMTGESSEEAKETIKPQTKQENDEIGNFFGALVGSFLQDSDSLITATSEESTDNKKQNSIQTDSDDDDEKSNQFDILLHNPFSDIYENKEPKSSEEMKTDDEEENKESSEENLFSIITDDKSDEDSNEVTPSHTVEMKISDLTKSSEEKKDDSISENDIKEFTSLLITLSAIHDDMYSVKNNPKHIDDDKLRDKEGDEYLSLFGSVLDKILEDELKSKENKDDDNDDKHDNNSDENEVDKNIYSTNAINDSDEIDDNNYYTATTTKNDSSEESKENGDNNNVNNDNDSDESQEDKRSHTISPIEGSDEIDDNNYYTATTPKNDSEEDSNADDDDDDKNDNKDNADDTNASDSNENELNLISIVFQGVDEKHINDHKYEIIELSSKLKPTTAPYMPELASPSGSHDHDVIQEYVELREELDIEQDSLQKNEIALDKDFYTIITNKNNNGNENISKFEKDIYGVQENLDRIKRNINAMQNLHSKLYFHKLITAAVKDVQNKSKE